MSNLAKLYKQSRNLKRDIACKQRQLTKTQEHIKRLLITKHRHQFPL